MIPAPKDWTAKADQAPFQFPGRMADMLTGATRKGNAQIA
jgi:hypothetical protein